MARTNGEKEPLAGLLAVLRGVGQGFGGGDGTWKFTKVMPLRVRGRAAVLDGRWVKERGGGLARGGGCRTEWKWCSLETRRSDTGL